MKTLQTLIANAAMITATPFAITAQAQAVDHGNMPGMKMDEISAMKTDQPAATEMTEFIF